MCKIVEVLGIPPVHIIEKSPRKDKYFEKDSSGQYILKGRIDHEREPPSKYGTKSRKDGKRVRIYCTILLVSVFEDCLLVSRNIESLGLDYSRTYWELIEEDLMEPEQGKLDTVRWII